MEQLLNHPVSCLQLAENGNWENANPIPMGGTFPESLEKWLKTRSSDIAIEAFYGDKNTDEFCFFGLRLETLNKSEQTSFLRHLTAHMDAHTQAQETMNIIASYFNEADFPDAITDQPDFLELGAEGYWKSYGSLKIWEKGQDRALSIEQIQEKAPQLLEPFKRPIMMELAWNNPIPMWLAFPVSILKNGAYLFDTNRYNTLIKKNTGC